MITLAELIEATTWLRPQERIRITLWDKSKVYCEEEFKDIDLDVYNLARYGNYFVSDIDVEKNDDEELFLTCMIYKG